MSYLSRDGLGYELVTLSDRDRRLWLEAYGWGVLHGIDRGREQADAEAAVVWADVARRVHAMASQPTYAELCHRRGDTERLERALEHEARLGFRSAS